MSETTVLTVRLRKETKDRLDALAESVKRPGSLLAADAIEAFVEASAWQVEEIRTALLEADAGGPFVSHEDAMAYLEARARGEQPEPPEGAIRKP